MRIEQTFRDAKSLLSMRAIINRINNPSLKDGLILLLFASWLFLVEVGRKAKESGVLLQSLLNMAENGYYSPITLGRLWLCACATRTYGGLEMGHVSFKDG